MRNIYDLDVPLDLTTLTDQEARREDALSAALGALLLTPGVAYGLTPGLDSAAGAVFVSPGAALWPDSGGLTRLVTVVTPQRFPVPAAPGAYRLNLSADALVDTHPGAINPASGPRTVYGATERVAYAPGQMPPAAGVIVNPGLGLQSGDTEPTGASMTLARVLRNADNTLSLDPSFYPHVAAARAPAPTPVPGSGGAPIVTADLDLGGYGLVHVLSLVPAIGHTDVQASVTLLNGLSAAQIVAEAQTGMTGGTPAPAAPQAHAYTLDSAHTLRSAQPAPRNATFTLPAAPKTTEGVSFSGVGELLSVSGTTVTVRPEVGYVPDLKYNYAQGDPFLFTGPPLGLLGANTGFYVSTRGMVRDAQGAAVVAADGTVQYRMALQRLVPGSGTPVTLVDSDTVAAQKTADPPALYLLSTTTGTLTWGGRSESISVDALATTPPAGGNSISPFVEGRVLVTAQPDGLYTRQANTTVHGTLLITPLASAVVALSENP